MYSSCILIQCPSSDFKQFANKTIILCYTYFSPLLHFSSILIAFTSSTRKMPCRKTGIKWYYNERENREKHTWIFHNQAGESWGGGNFCKIPNEDNQKWINIDHHKQMLYLKLKTDEPAGKRKYSMTEKIKSTTTYLL